VVTGIEPTTSGLLDQRRSRSDNQTQEYSLQFLIFHSFLGSQVQGYRTRLRGDAVPTENLPPPPAPAKHELSPDPSFSDSAYAYGPAPSKILRMSQEYGHLTEEEQAAMTLLVLKAAVSGGNRRDWYAASRVT